MVPSFSMERQRYFHRFKKSNYLKISKLIYTYIIYTLYKEIREISKRKKCSEINILQFYFIIL